MTITYKQALEDIVNRCYIDEIKMKQYSVDSRLKLYDVKNRCHFDKIKMKRYSVDSRLIKEKAPIILPEERPNQPGNIIHISIPARAEINILNLIELTSPTGISLDVRIPFLNNKLSEIFIMDKIYSLLNNNNMTLDIKNTDSINLVTT